MCMKNNFENQNPKEQTLRRMEGTAEGNVNLDDNRWKTKKKNYCPLRKTQVYYFLKKKNLVWDHGLYV